MGIDGRHQLGDPVPAGRDKFEDRYSDLGSKIPYGLVGLVTVGLVDDHNVGDLQQAGLGRLDGIARAGIEHDDGGVGDGGDLDLGLPDSHRLQQHDVVGQRGQ